MLQFRSKTEEIAVPFDTRVKRYRGGSAVRLDLQLDAHLPLKELYWDAYVQIRQFGAVYPVKIVSAKPLQRWQLFFTNCQALVDDTHILFPYYRKGGQLCYCYRPLCEYDTAAVRLREITAYTLYMLFRPLWQRQKNWVVYEKFCKTAQDNSYYFFKYCMEHLPEKERRHIYYIMDSPGAGLQECGRLRPPGGALYESQAHAAEPVYEDLHFLGLYLPFVCMAIQTQHCAPSH